MEMKIGEYEFPDNCPKKCPDLHYMETIDQGAMCIRCPIFNCTGPENIRLMRPEDYRLEWAKEWHEWFRKVGAID
jgi:hypothetical protein